MAECTCELSARAEPWEHFRGNERKPACPLYEPKPAHLPGHFVEPVPGLAEYADLLQVDDDDQPPYRTSGWQPDENV